MSVESAKAKLDAQPGDPATGYISKADHQDSYTELVDDTALTGATTAEALTISGTLNGRDPDNLVAGPASATDNALVRFDGTGGKTVQGSGITVDDSGSATVGQYLYVTGGILRLGGSLAAGVRVGSEVNRTQLQSGILELGTSSNPGPIITSGTGSPEGVVTAPVGSIWTDTAATTGAIRWIKASGTGNTGWVVEYGDTGVRNMSAVALSNGWTTSEYRLQRVGNTVHFTIGADRSASSADAICSLPSGFRPANYLYFAAVTNQSDDLARFYIDPSGNLTAWGRSDMAGTILYCTATFITTNAWPTSLPGSAA